MYSVEFKVPYPFTVEFGKEAIGKISLKEGDSYRCYDVVPTTGYNDVPGGWTTVSLRYQNNEIMVPGTYNHPEGYQIQAKWVEDEDEEYHEEWLNITIMMYS